MANTKIPAELLGLNGGDLVLDADGDTKIDAATDDEIHFTVAGSETVYMGVTSYNSSDRIVLTNTGGNASMAIVGSTSGESSIFMADGTSGDASYRGYVQYQHTNDNMNFGTAGSEAMRIDSSGKVGIGTTSPTTALHAYSSASSTPFVVESTTNTYLGIKNTSQTAYVGAVGTTMTFENNGSERMRIGPNGQLSVGIAGSGEKLYIYGNDASQYLGLFYHDGNNQNRYGIRIVAGADDASGVIYHVRCDDGDGHVLGYIQHESGTLSIQQASDERLKENIVDSTLEGISTLKNIRQREFNLKRDTSKTKIIGYVAQEMESVYPAAISVMDATQDGSAPEDDPENPYKTLSKTALIDVLIKATQEQQTIIEDLKARIETLEG